MRYETGQTIVRRATHPDGRIAAAQCGRVVADDERGLLLWLGLGSANIRRTALDGTPTRSLSLRAELAMPTLLALGAPRTRPTLLLIPLGAAHSIWWSWSADGDFAGWYVNLETRARRWAGGVDVRDQTLDVRVSPERVWSWKDEDDFAEQTGDPLFWDADEAAAIRAEGERVIALAEHGTFPFDGTWRDFTPDPEWPPTALPPWWDVPADGRLVAAERAAARPAD
jgi:hypothetical protein